MAIEDNMNEHQFSMWTPKSPLRAQDNHSPAMPSQKKDWANRATYDQPDRKTNNRKYDPDIHRGAYAHRLVPNMKPNLN